MKYDEIMVCELQVTKNQRNIEIRTKRLPKIGFKAEWGRRAVLWGSQNIGNVMKLWSVNFRCDKIVREIQRLGLNLTKFEYRKEEEKSDQTCLIVLTQTLVLKIE